MPRAFAIWILLLALVPIAGVAARKEEGGALLALAESHYYLHANDETRHESEVLAAQAMLGNMQSQTDEHGECSSQPCNQHLISILRDLGLAYSQLGLHMLSLRYYQSALARDENDAQSHADVASELMELGRNDEAQAAFAKASALSKQGDAQIQMYVASFYLSTDRPVDAHRHFETCVKLDAQPKLNQYCAIGLALAKIRGSDDSMLLGLTTAHEWPGPALRYLRGEIDESALAKAVETTSDPVMQRERLSEALYYVGEDRLRRGERATALRYFRANLALKVEGFEETLLSARRIEQLHGSDDPPHESAPVSHIPIS